MHLLLLSAKKTIKTGRLKPDGLIPKYDDIVNIHILEIAVEIDFYVDWFIFGQNLGIDFMILIKIRHIYPNFRHTYDRVKAMVILVYYFIANNLHYEEKLIHRGILARMLADATPKTVHKLLSMSIGMLLSGPHTGKWKTFFKLVTTNMGFLCDTSSFADTPSHFIRKHFS